MYRIGQGYDLHATTEGESICLGGVSIPAPFALRAHSDGDVLVHAIIDALLGASGGPDIGTLYPDTDQRFKGCNSCDLLRDTLKRINAKGFEIVNVDTTIIAQSPKLMDFKTAIAENLATLMEIGLSEIAVKAKTNEKVDAVGENRAIAAQAAVLLKLTK